jgi:uncharacterized membrane protein YhfC
MIIFAYSLSILAMLLAPVVLAVLLRRKFRVPWLLFAVGSLTFIGSQIVHLPLNSLLANIGLLPKAGEMDSVPLLQTALLVGLTAGLCEETARAVGYWLLKKYRRFEHGMMLGLGHGGIEAMVFGGVMTAATISSLIALQGMDLDLLNLTGEQMSQVLLQMEALEQGPWLALAPLLERLIAIAIPCRALADGPAGIHPAQCLILCPGSHLSPGNRCRGGVHGKPRDRSLDHPRKLSLIQYSRHSLAVENMAPVFVTRNSPGSDSWKRVQYLPGGNSQRTHSAVAHQALPGCGGGIWTVRFGFPFNGVLYAADFFQY